MDSEIKNNENEILEESLTEFPEPVGYGNNTSLFSGKFFSFFKSVFGTKKQSGPGRPPRKATTALEGDSLTPLGGDVFDSAGVGGISVSKGFARLPAIENQRTRRYKKFEFMDEYPEIGAAFDIYADDSTQEDIKGNSFVIKTTDKLIREEIEKFVKNTKLDYFMWDIVRNTVKYGDCFVENIVDLNNTAAGIQRLKILNPNFIYRVEDQYGYLQNFLQEIPEKGQSMYAGQTNPMSKKNTIVLDKNQVVHFRRRTADPNYYPYGKGVAAMGVRAWESLRLMEDSMIIYRVQRAPERRAFYIETGNMPATKVETFMERVKDKFKKEKFFNPGKGIDERYNPLASDEDFFIPMRNGQGTKIDTLPGAQNLGEVDDVKYFRDKLLAAMKIPKDFIVEKDKSPERKANLSQLDVKFAKAVHRVQKDVELGIGTLVRRHLMLKGFEKKFLKDVEVTLCPPSDMHEKRRLEIDEQKIRIVQGVQGLMLFDKEYLYKTYFGMTEEEISDMKDRVSEEAEKDAALAQQGAPMAGGPVPAPAGGEVPPEGESMGGDVLDDFSDSREATGATKT